MNIYPQNQYIPYTYLIGWSKLDRWYYGAEYGSKSKIANPNNLWNTYFTSSKHVKEFREKYGEPDIIEIRKTFIDEEAVRIWEHKVLKRMNIPKDERWLNKSDGSWNSLNSEERSRISKERMADPEIKARMIKAQKETMNTPEYKLKKSLKSKEMWQNPEHRKKIKQINKKPETIELKSKAQKEAQNRPDVKAKNSKQLKEKWSNTEFKEQRLILQKEILSRPEVKAKLSKSSKELWLDPSYRLRNLESRKNAPVFYCECCKRFIKGLSNWKSHLRSNKHKKNLIGVP